MPIARPSCDAEPENFLLRQRPVVALCPILDISYFVLHHRPVLWHPSVTESASYSRLNPSGGVTWANTILILSLSFVPPSICARASCISLTTMPLFRKR